MLNSLLMLGSTSQKMKSINYLCVIVWIGYMLVNANLETGLGFAIVNIIVFLITFLLGQTVKGKYSNVIVSIFSILIWSILIDIICFYMYPQFTMGQNIIGYIWNGIMFNSKYIISNVIALAIAYGCDYIVKKIHSILKKGKAEVLVSSI